ncbi:MAG: hypothetical protein M3077_11445 [Candidatus Dormibacteraeota bacterium]|nr:hypothetical protein [Candidatus Dormibacteraeota bacterium]
MDRTPRDRLYWLLDLFLAAELDANRFSEEFGRTYVDILETALSATEHEVFGEVFSVTNWHATDEERAGDSYPARTSDNDVRLAVVRAKAKLRQALS